MHNTDPLGTPAGAMCPNTPQAWQRSLEVRARSASHRCHGPHSLPKPLSPQVLWTVYKSFPSDCSTKSLSLLLTDISGRPVRDEVHVSKRSVVLVAGVKRVTAAGASGKQITRPSPKGHKVTLQKQFLQVVTGHLLGGEHNDS